MSYIRFHYGAWPDGDYEEYGERIIYAMHYNNQGQIHRIDGPAVNCSFDLIKPNPTNYDLWYYQDSLVEINNCPVCSQKEFEQWLNLRAFQ